MPANITKIIVRYLPTLSSSGIVCLDCSVKEVGYTAILLNTYNILNKKFVTSKYYTEQLN